MKNLIELMDFLKSKMLYLSIFSLAFFFLSLAYTLSLTPKHLTSVVITENTKDQSLNTKSMVSLALGQSSSDALNFFHHLKEVLFSMEVTAALNRDNALLEKFYETDVDGKYLPVWNLNSVLKSIKFGFLGVDYKPIPNNYMLNEHFRGIIGLTYDDAADVIYVQSFSSNPTESSNLIMSLLKQADNYYKFTEQENIEQRINFLTKEISSTVSISQKEALGSILENELLKKTLINTNSLYKIKVIRPIESSEYPVTPNVLFNIAIITLLGFFSIISLFTINFAKSKILIEEIS